jgi:hypothetical protein
VFVADNAGIEVTAVRHETGPPFWHGVARVAVTIDGFPLYLASAHLAPSSPSLRAIEAQPFRIQIRALSAGITDRVASLLPDSGPGYHHHAAASYTLPAMDYTVV